jgi:uncharacterized repeat protein (TIGR03803 family)
MIIIRSLRAAMLLTLAAIVAAPAPAADNVTFRVIYANQGYGPGAGLIEGSPGVFYSTTGGGPSAAISVTSQGSMTILASFPGGFFNSLLLSGPSGRFYSSLYTGVYSIFSVTSAPNDERTYPAQSIGAILLQNLPDGAFLAAAGNYPDGLWRLTQCGLDGVITSFATFSSGQRVESATRAGDGNYYGVTLGTDVVPSSSNYAFRATPSGALTTLYTFPPNTFARFSATPLLQADDGNLYGSTATGGANGTGTIYKLTPGGQFTLLHSFEPGKYAGGPNTLIEASDGNLYGDAQSPGGAGQLFRITKSGQYTLLYQMNGANGVCPCWLVQGSDGIIYGMAAAGGNADHGVVFAMDAGLPMPKPHPQSFSPQSGAAGANVRIWGQNLLSAAVQFNGVAAVRVSNSGSNYVWATVPAGAVTGPITVTTPGGAETTHASFTVQ